MLYVAVCDCERMRLCEWVCVSVSSHTFVLNFVNFIQFDFVFVCWSVFTSLNCCVILVCGIFPLFVLRISFCFYLFWIFWILNFVVFESYDEWEWKSFIDSVAVYLQTEQVFCEIRSHRTISLFILISICCMDKDKTPKLNSKKQNSKIRRSKKYFCVCVRARERECVQK